MTQAFFVIVAAGVTAGFAVWQLYHRRHLHRTASEWALRDRIFDCDFLQRCGPFPNELAKEVAVAARRAIAVLATVPSDTIYPENSFADDLSDLPYWDSLDWLGFILETERQMNYRVVISSQIVMEGIAKVGGYRRLSVGDLIHVTAIAATLREPLNS